MDNDIFVRQRECAEKMAKTAEKTCDVSARLRAVEQKLNLIIGMLGAFVAAAASALVGILIK